MVQRITIEAGDSLYTLAHKYFGDETQWRAVGDKIKKSIFDPLIAGEKIDLPDKRELLDYGKTIASNLLQSELKKRYPNLDLSSIKTIPGLEEIKIIDWIL